MTRAFARFGLSLVDASALRQERHEHQRLHRKLDHERDKLRKLEHERTKVRKLVEIRDSFVAERSEWARERGKLERRLACLEPHPWRLPSSRTARAAARIGAPAAATVAGPRPLRALVLVPLPIRKTIFEFVDKANVSTDPSQGPFDLLVTPRPEKADLQQLPDRVPGEVWDAVRSGATRLVLDGSAEGWPRESGFLERFLALAESSGIAPGEMVYLTQNRFEAYHRRPRPGWAPNPLRVVIYDYYLHKVLSPMLKDGKAVFAARRAQYHQAPRPGRRAFLSLNRWPRGHRVLLAGRLLRDGLWDKGFISFGGLGQSAGGGISQEVRRQLTAQGFDGAARELEPLIAPLQEKGVIFLGARASSADTHASRRTAIRASDLEEYRRSWFSVVTESEMHSETLRITEKALKPVLNFHPFVVFGNAGALQLIRGYGFQTFPEIFDESYDDEENPARRFDMIYDQVSRLARLDEAELERLEASVAEKIIFNARWGLIELPRIFQETILPATLEQLLDGPRQS